jgi:transcriptional regulator with XRE-family HTH domain
MYAAELRYKREQAGLSRQELGDRLFIGPSLVAKLEAAERRIRPEFAETLDQVFNSDGFFVRNLSAGRATPYRGTPDRCYHALLAAEQAAPQEVRRGAARAMTAGLMRHDRSLPGVRAFATRAGALT